MIARHTKSAFTPPVNNPNLASAHQNNQSARPRTLIADDDPGILVALQLLLGNNSYELETVSSPAAVLEAITRSQFDVVLMDLNYTRDTTSGREGLDLVSRVHALDPALPIVVMTGWGTVDLAVEAMHLGVCDFVQKPWENSRLLKTLHKQVKHARARRNVQHRLAHGAEVSSRTVYLTRGGKHAPQRGALLQHSATQVHHRVLRDRKHSRSHVDVYERRA